MHIFIFFPLWDYFDMPWNHLFICTWLIVTVQWITSLAQVNQSNTRHVIMLIILVFLEVKCDSNMVGYHYIYDILGANYGTLSLIIIPPPFNQYTCQQCVSCIPTCANLVKGCLVPYYGWNLGESKEMGGRSFEGGIYYYYWYYFLYIVEGGR